MEKSKIKNKIIGVLVLTGLAVAGVAAGSAIGFKTAPKSIAEETKITEGKVSNNFSATTATNHETNNVVFNETDNEIENEIATQENSQEATQSKAIKRGRIKDLFRDANEKPSEIEQEKSFEENNFTEHSTESEEKTTENFLNELIEELSEKTEEILNTPTSEETINEIESPTMELKDVGNFLSRKSSIATMSVFGALGLLGIGMSFHKKRTANQHLIKYNLGSEYHKAVVRMLDTSKSKDESIAKANNLENKINEISKDLNDLKNSSVNTNIKKTNNLEKDLTKFKKQLATTEEEIKNRQLTEIGLLKNIYSIAREFLQPESKDIRDEKLLMKYFKNNSMILGNVFEDKNTKISSKLSGSLKKLTALTKNKKISNIKRFKKHSASILKTLDDISNISGDGRILINEIINDKKILSSNKPRFTKTMGNYLNKIEDLATYLNISNKDTAKASSDYIIKLKKSEKQELKNHSKKASKNLDKSIKIKEKIEKDPILKIKYFGYNSDVNGIPVNSVRYIMGNNLNDSLKNFFDNVYFTQLHNDQANYQNTINLTYNNSKKESFVCAFDNKKAIELTTAKIISELPIKNLSNIEIVEKTKPYLRKSKIKVSQFTLENDPRFESLYENSKEKVENFENTLKQATSQTAQNAQTTTQTAQNAQTTTQTAQNAQTTTQTAQTTQTTQTAQTAQNNTQKTTTTAQDERIKKLIQTMEM